MPIASDDVLKLFHTADFCGGILTYRFYFEQLRTYSELYSYLFRLKLYLWNISKRKIKGKMSKDKKVKRVFEYENYTRVLGLPSEYSNTRCHP